MGAELEVTKFRKVTGLFGACQGRGSGGLGSFLGSTLCRNYKNVPDALSNGESARYRALVRTRRTCWQ